MVAVAVMVVVAAAVEVAVVVAVVAVAVVVGWVARRAWGICTAGSGRAICRVEGGVGLLQLCQGDG